MFKKKPKENATIDSENVTGKDYLEPYKKPMVFLFDFEESVEDKLKQLRINSHMGSFGTTVKVNNKKHDEKFLRLNHDYPENLHEFDIVILDLTRNQSEEYDPTQHQLNNITGNTAHALLSEYPEQIFDPRPLSIHLASNDIKDLFEKKSVIIAFCGSENTSEYQLVEITGDGARRTRKDKYSNFGYYENFPNYKCRSGTKVKLPETETKFSPLFQNYLDSINFKTIFYHPTEWIEGENQKNKDFIPLLLNERDEIVSYAHCIGESIVFVFPDIADKPNFVCELFKTYLPEVVPEIFPFHGEFKWLDDGNYPLPGERKLLQERAEIEEKFNKDMAANKEKAASLKIKYKFLSDLISETGHALVPAVEAYLKWLGFESVVNLDDENPNLLEEDIQVDCKDRFLVIEVKGIGGTSTDKDCSQISKIKFRRAEQRGKFDVFGLYIVNHQRYMPPKSRVNPPFTENQIKDAVHDKRGLLTTYELYKAYFLIEDGILKKTDVRESLFKTGLITLKPENIESIGVPHELFMDGQVAIVNLNGLTLSVGDTLIVRKEGDYSKATIKSLQVNDNDVNTCNEGEVGIKLDIKIKNNSELYVRNTNSE